MKVLYLLESFPRKVSQTFVVNEMIELIHMGIDIEIAAFSSDEAFHENIKKNRLLERLTKIYNTKNPLIRAIIVLLSIVKLFFTNLVLLCKIGSVSYKNRYAFSEFLHAIVAVPKMVKISSVDIIHVPFPSSALIVVCEIIHQLKGAKFSATYRAGEIYSSAVNQRYSKMSDAFITISEYNRENLKKIMPFDHEVSIVHSAIDITLFSAVERGSSDSTFHLISVGRFVPKKGLCYAIAAVDELIKKDMNVELTIIGDGPLKEELQNQITSLGLEHFIHLPGPQPNEKVKEMIAEADLFVLPCIVDDTGDRDILPNVLKESMAMSVPVVTTNISGITELIEHERTGLLVPPKDVNALSQAITTMIEDENLYNSIKKASRDTIVNDFNIKVEAIKMKELFASISNQ